LFNVLRAGWGTRARYSSTLVAVVCGFVEDVFFIDLLSQDQEHKQAFSQWTRETGAIENSVVVKR
jgi:hypothetical protein